MPFMFRVTTYGVRQAERNILQLAENAANTKPAMEEIYRTILDIEHETFEKEGARGNFPRWAKLKLDTVVRKKNPMILQESKRLYESMTTYRSPDATVRIHKDHIVFAPKLPYGRLHQKGGTTGGKIAVHMPARPYIRFTEQDATAFAGEILHHVMGKRRTGVRLLLDE